MPDAAADRPEPAAAVPPEPRATIVVPTRERVPLLRAAIHSILASGAEAEAALGIRTRVLVVDDASPTDATERLASELGVDYVRIPVHDGRNNPASGIALGIASVTTEYCALFGDDDLMLPRHLRLHLEAMETGADVCSTAFYRTDASLRTVREVVPAPAHLGDLLAGRISVNDGSMLRTSMVQELEWNPDLEQEILYPIWLELMLRGARFHLITEPTFLYRRHDENVSDRLDERDAELRRQIQKRYRAIALEKLGAIPEPTRPVPTPAFAAPAPRSSLPPPRPAWRRAASLAKRTVRRLAR